MTEADKNVYDYYLDKQTGCTAYICSLGLRRRREEVSKSLQRLKRKGLMKNDGSYWMLSDA